MTDHPERGKAVPSLMRKPEHCERCDGWHLPTMACDWTPPAAAPIRDGEPVTFPQFRCPDCGWEWKPVAIEGEVLGGGTCTCGAQGHRVAA